MTDRPTDRPHYSVYNNKPHLRTGSTAMRLPWTVGGIEWVAACGEGSFLPSRGGVWGDENCSQFQQRSKLSLWTQCIGNRQGSCLTDPHFTRVNSSHRSHSGELRLVKIGWNVHRGPPGGDFSECLHAFIKQCVQLTTLRMIYQEENDDDDDDGDEDINDIHRGWLVRV